MCGVCDFLILVDGCWAEVQRCDSCKREQAQVFPRFKCTHPAPNTSVYAPSIHFQIRNFLFWISLVVWPVFSDQKHWLLHVCTNTSNINNLHWLPDYLPHSHLPTHLPSSSTSLLPRISVWLTVWVASLTIFDFLRPVAGAAQLPSSSNGCGGKCGSAPTGDGSQRQIGEITILWSAGTATRSFSS